MEDTKQTTTISSQEMQEISVEEIAKNLKVIAEVNVAVWRRNRDGNLVVVPVKKLEQYLGEKDAGTYKFYIEQNWKERIREYESVLKKKAEAPAVQEDAVLMKEVEKYGKVEELASVFRSMPVVEREEILDKCISSLGGNEEKKTLDISSVISMVEVLSSTFYANNANLEDNNSADNVKDNSNGVLIKSGWIAKILINLFDQKKFPYSDLKIIDKISTGSKTMDHINRVFLRFITFCIFYNEYIGEGLFTKNIRGAFRERYHRYYKKRFPDTSITIERIFKDGIRRIEKENELEEYVLGALLFDIGKIPFINYHDGSEPYDMERVKKHALHSYNMIVKAKHYPFTVLAMSVFHHEYYGGKGSYNFTKPLLGRFSGKNITEENIKYFVSYDKADFINGTALSFFPCKVLEMIDVFDALVGKKNIPSAVALRTMKKEFITKNLRIDPILFRIFLEYNVKCGELGNEEMESIDSIIF